MTTISTLQFVQIVLMILGFTIWVVCGILKGIKKVKDVKQSKLEQAKLEQEKELKAKQALDKLMIYIKETYKDNKVEKLAKDANLVKGE